MLINLFIKEEVSLITLMSKYRKPREWNSNLLEKTKTKAITTTKKMKTKKVSLSMILLHRRNSKTLTFKLVGLSLVNYIIITKLQISWSQ